MRVFFRDSNDAAKLHAESQSLFSVQTLGRQPCVASVSAGETYAESGIGRTVGQIDWNLRAFL